jgi:phage terminase small subunit
MQNLTKNDIKFVKEVVEHGNASVAAKQAHGITNDNYAKLKGHRELQKPKIQKAIQEYLPDDLLSEKHLALLNKMDEKGEIDVTAVSKGLEMAYNLTGSYAPEKSVTVSVQETITKEQKQKIAKRLLENE